MSPRLRSGWRDLLVHRYGDLPDLPALADVRVTSLVQSAVVDNAAMTTLFAAEKAEKRKRDQYEAACDQLRLQLVPMAVELDGALGRGTQSFLAHCRNHSLDFYVAGATWASASRAGKIRSPSRHLRPKNIFGDQIMGCGGQFGD